MMATMFIGRGRHSLTDTGRESPYTTTTTVRVPLNRPKVTFKLDTEEGPSVTTTMRSEKDPLPIVELKPFVPKVWRREKSLPSFYVKGNERRESSGSGSGKREKETRSKSPRESVASDTTTETPPSQPQPVNLSSRKTFHYYVNIFGDFQSQKEHLNKVVADSGLRPTSRSLPLHPQTEWKNRKQQQHMDSIVPGFITRDERSKTTLYEISEGDSFSRSHSCMKQALNQQDVKKQQDIQVKGRQMKDKTNTKSLQYLAPFKNVYVNTTWPIGIKHGSTLAHLRENRNSLERFEQRNKTPIYDVIDRKGTLPSLQINAESLKSRQRRDSLDEGGQGPMPTPTKSHKIGGIRNSLKVLSSHGVPTQIERQLSFELEVTLSRYRKSRDYFPFEISPSEIAKYLPHPNMNPTPGELYIQKGLVSNTSVRRPNVSRSSSFLKPGHKRATEALGPFLSRSGNLKQRRKVDKENETPFHNDGMEYEDELRSLRTADGTARADDHRASAELAELFDTPRSLVDINHGNEIRKDGQMDSSFSSTVTMSPEDMHTKNYSIKSDEKIGDSISQKGQKQNVEDKNGKGRTFITSDPIAAAISVSG